MIYHRRSIRLKGYDYSQAGLYFVTICVQNRECLFGEIVDGEMMLNECGNIANTIWNELPQHYPYVALDRFVVMPNHIHYIIEITDFHCRGAINRAPTMEINGGFAGEHNPMFHNNLPRIVRWFKGRITFECRKINPDFAWQRNYHEHIIRDDQSYQRIADYIEKNSENWQKDKFFN
ncbi:MAG: hypothetical protein LBE36_10970 [Flavobacteriaceae bacterium]|jgi:REP element-mobilizing transposase RayT|nr:hypothetical protein [Flavobacteriaceae bacterium]